MVIVVIIVIFMLNLAGCYGSFTLTKKLLSWNDTIEDKWMESAVMWVMIVIPVYESAAFIDIVVLNTAEFWTGKNPLAMQNGETSTQFVENDGKTYKIVSSQNQINIKEIAGPDIGKELTISYLSDIGTWTIDDAEKTSTIAELNGREMKLMYPDDSHRIVIIGK
jgi:hypothetical protein